jgi:hypothetical protein
MQDAVQIRALSARYHLARRDASVEARLDGLLRRVLDEALETALERAGVPLHAEVCLRKIASRVALDLGATDDALVVAWSLALSQSIAAATRNSDTDVLIFGSRRHALATFAADVAAAELARAWAYRQLGLGDLALSPVPRRAELLVRALVRDPAAIVPRLVDLARRARLRSLSPLLTPAQWTRLAHAAAGALGAAEAARTLLSPATTSTSGHAPESMFDEPDAALPGPSPLTGPLARELAAVAASLAPEALTAAALLCVLASDPARLADLPARTRAIARVLSPGTAAPTPEHRSDPHPATRRPPSATAIATATATATTTEQTEPADAPLLALRPHGDTELGGLLFLLHLVAELALPAELELAYPARSSTWVLHQWARALTGAEPHDPARLAFAGLPPDARPPTVGEPPPTPDESASIEDYAHRIAAALHRRLGEPELPLPALVDRVTRRRARIVADPGWLEVHLSMRDVDTAIRRAGLDLDPGFVPWLGVVLGFVYA